jgi:DNA-directed RNA polymerase beta subunit
MKRSWPALGPWSWPVVTAYEQIDGTRSWCVPTTNWMRDVPVDIYRLSKFSSLNQSTCITSVRSCAWVDEVKVGDVICPSTDLGELALGQTPWFRLHAVERLLEDSILISERIVRRSPTDPPEEFEVMACDTVSLRKSTRHPQRR